jgi:hypothetical protein
MRVNPKRATFAAGNNRYAVVFLALRGFSV